MKFINRRINLPALLSGAIALIIFLLTASHDVQLIDSGELAVVAYTLGIAHPTGYPLYTLLARLFTLVPFGEIVFRTVLLSAIAAALSTFLLTLIAARLSFYLSYIYKTKNVGRYMILIPGGILFSTGYLVWRQGITNEVYSLGLFLCSLILFLLVPSLSEGDKSGISGNGIRCLILGIYIWGLALTDHLSSIVMAVPIAFVIFSGKLYRRIKPGSIVLAALVMVMALSVYLYLPVRSSLQPEFDWGNPTNWHRFSSHVSGWQYRVWMFDQSIDGIMDKIGHGFRLIYDQYGFITIWLAVVGLYFSYKINPRLFYIFILMIGVNLLYASNYNIPDIDPYYLPSIFVTGILIILGAAGLAQLLVKSKNKLLSYMIAAVLVAGIAYNFALYRPTGWNRPDAVADMVIRDMMRSAGKEAFILSNNWDFYSPWMYNRRIYYIRPDLMMVDKELCRRSWYLEYLLKHMPELTDENREDFEYFLKLVYPFEHGLKFNSAELTRQFNKLFNGIFETRMDIGPVYTTFPSDREIVHDYFTVPEGLLFRLYPRRIYVAYNIPEFQLERKLRSSRFDFNKEFDPRTYGLLRFYPIMMNSRAKFMQQVGDQQSADVLNRRMQYCLSRMRIR
jgi:hypothetical protein